ncbi:MAG TPA: molecular chaperone TorD family protein [Acidimicrobiales bacterium]|nr:molecular chaperone TorD family protein [Acidimicrobiales bacterium]
MPADTLTNHLAGKPLATQLDDFAAAYAAMARFLLAPADTSLLSQLAAPGQIEAWPLAGDPHTCRGCSHLAASLVANEGVEVLNEDYQRLFVGPEHLLAPPYESVHRTVDRLLFDGPTFEVRALYRELGMQAPRLNREPDDHIGLEMSFLSLVCNRALEAFESGSHDELEAMLAMQRRFLSEHLLRWGSDCLALVEAGAATRFYRGVGALGLGLLVHASSW